MIQSLKERFNEAKQSHSILYWFSENSVTANILMLSIALTAIYLLGMFGLFGGTTKLRLESFPTSPPDTVQVVASLSGSTPEDVEEGLTAKIEEAIKGVVGIDKVVSTSTSTSARIDVRAKSGYDLERLLDDVKTEVDALTTLPDELDKVTTSMDKDIKRIIWISMSGNVSEKMLKENATKLKDKLLESENIDMVDIRGARDYEITLEVSDDSLEKYGLTFSEVATAIEQNSINLGLGTISSQQGELGLRIQNQAYYENDFASIVVRTLDDGSQILVKDIATVQDGFIDQKVLSQFNDEYALTLELQSEGDTNVIEAVRSAKAIVAEFEQSADPQIHFTTWVDRTESVRDRLRIFRESGTQSIILVMLLLTLFLNLRLAFWVAIGIPISFAGAIICMYFMGVSISLMTLFGFILVLGVVVDDAIVIGESIYSTKKRYHNAPESTLIGLSRVSTPATFGVLTTIAAFAPLTQVEGRMGSVLAGMAWVVVFSLTFSLIESKLILPSHLRNVIVTNDKNAKTWWQKFQKRIADGIEKGIDKYYLPWLKFALNYRYFTLFGFASVLVLSIGLVGGGVIGWKQFPRVEFDYIRASVEMEPTISVDKMHETAVYMVNKLEEAEKQISEERGLDYDLIKNIYIYSESDQAFSMSAETASNTLRDFSNEEVIRRWRQLVGEIDGIKSSSLRATIGFVDADVEVELLSDDLNNLKEASEILKDKLASFSGVKDISTNLDTGKPEVHIELKPEAYLFGVTKTQLAQEIRNAFYGLEAQRFQRKQDEVRVKVRLPEEDRTSLSNLYDLKIRTSSGQIIPISSVATLIFKNGFSAINRINGKKAITVRGNTDNNVTSSEEVIAGLQPTFNELKANYGIEIGFGGEAEENAKSNASLVQGMFISLISIYILLAIPLKSYGKPLIIMSVIPFGVVGAILGHLLLGMDITNLSLFGVLALSGVVVNDSLVLIASIQTYRNEGMSHTESIIETGQRRFRPVILTSLTTFLGLVPLLLETSPQSQFLIPMAVSLGFGILFATVITLVLVPVLYYIIGDIKNLFGVKHLGHDKATV